MRIYSGKPGAGISGNGKDRRELLFINSKIKTKKYNESVKDILSSKPSDSDETDELLERFGDSLQWRNEGETMRLNHKQKVVLTRGIKSLAALLLAGAFAWFAGPDGAELVGVQTQALLVAILTPTFQMVWKGLKYGNDDGENADLSLLTLAPRSRDAMPGEEADANH